MYICRYSRSVGWWLGRNATHIVYMVTFHYLYVVYVMCTICIFNSSRLSTVCVEKCCNGFEQISAQPLTCIVKGMVF